MTMTDMMTRKVKRFLKCERGTQMIEFAFLLPFLILLFASSVEMGRMFYTYTTLQKSTEVGARYLSTIILQSDGTYLSTETTAAKSLVVCGKIDCTGQQAIASDLSTANVTVTSPGTGIGTRYVAVSVSYAYQPRVFNLASLTGRSELSLNFTFSPSIKMRYML
jgi:Flp pilus assembly protein TadG